MAPYYQCFFCGEKFTPADSIAANTETLYAETYCSRKCQDIDSEQMMADIKSAQMQQEAASPETLTIPIVEEIKAGGFILKVRKP